MISISRAPTYTLAACRDGFAKSYMLRTDDGRRRGQAAEVAFVGLSRSLIYAHVFWISLFANIIDDY